MTRRDTQWHGDTVIRRRGGAALFAARDATVAALPTSTVAIEDNANYTLGAAFMKYTLFKYHFRGFHLNLNDCASIIRRKIKSLFKLFRSNIIIFKGWNLNVDIITKNIIFDRKSNRYRGRATATRRFNLFKFFKLLYF